MLTFLALFTKLMSNEGLSSLITYSDKDCDGNTPSEAGLSERGTSAKCADELKAPL